MNENIKKKKSRKGIIIVIVILMTICILIGGFFMFYESPQKTFKTGVEVLITKIKEIYSLKNHSGEIELDIINGNSLYESSINYKLNVSAPQSDINATLYYDDTSDEIEKATYKGNIKFKDNNLYLISNEFLDKYIKYELDKEYQELIEKVVEKSVLYRKLCTEIEISLANAIDESYLTKKIVNKEINGKKSLVFKSVISMDNLQLKEFMNKFFSELQTNENVLRLINEINQENVTKKEFKKSLNEILENNIGILENYEILKISLYTKLFSNEIVKLEITKDISEMEFNVTKKDSTYEISYKDKDSKLSINLEQKTNVINIDASIKKGNEEEFTIRLEIKMQKEDDIKIETPSVEEIYTEEEIMLIISSLFDFSTSEFIKE